VIDHVLRTLPVSDHCNLWPVLSHTWDAQFALRDYLAKIPETSAALAGVVDVPRLAAVSAALSQVARSTMLEQLEGSRPLGDWVPVQQVRLNERETFWLVNEWLCRLLHLETASRL
jgi:hypothetical protein